ncbi:hypothetical protein [Mangrovibacillus cuniculi]|uniref:YxiS n=1 Tax=Mangrovibacillus cuniculi TaxID=2593652 RepID=A0A7S8HF67_9BACI|nr:hypothetical protein [Mangrovibacillus cuniculi]QPC46493.1 hypothetical protein G8O30_05690 [Mangrovibacillus cuniculi]
MSDRQIQDKIIEQYKKDEHMMVLVFAQWCVNNDLDPHTVYLEAYPDQAKNPILQQMTDLTVPKEEAGEISFTTLMGVLSLFGNEELAHIVSIKQENLKK